MSYRISGWCLSAALCAALSLISTSNSSACVGARPLSMGGAFTGLADDANATYWNPAGLVQLERPEATVMHTTTNRDRINYQDYVAVVYPLNRAAVGLSWIRSNVYLDATNSIDKQDWYWVSLAYKLGPNTSIGVNVKSIENSLPGMETDSTYDVSLFHRYDEQLTFGLLVQDVNEPVISQYDFPVAYWGRNWRPGVAYRPNESSVASAELYDATDESDARSLRLGYERRLWEGVEARAGFYGIGRPNSSSLSLGMGFTGSFGEGQDNYSLDIAGMIGDLDGIFTSFSLRF